MPGTTADRVIRPDNGQRNERADALRALALALEIERGGCVLRERDGAIASRLADLVSAQVVAAGNAAAAAGV